MMMLARGGWVALKQLAAQGTRLLVGLL